MSSFGGKEERENGGWDVKDKERKVKFFAKLEAKQVQKVKNKDAFRVIT
jgi:hypothetical protein